LTCIFSRHGWIKLSIVVSLYSYVFCPFSRVLNCHILHGSLRVLTCNKSHYHLFLTTSADIITLLFLIFVVCYWIIMIESYRGLIHDGRWFLTGENLFEECYVGCFHEGWLFQTKKVLFKEWYAGHCHR